jgi:type II secretory ATPase GspE/PulE/Tfp pilus assembly ATPase PilB-like protein
MNASHPSRSGNHVASESEEGDRPLFREFDNGAVPDAILSELLHTAVKHEAGDLFFSSSPDGVDVSIRSLGIVRSIARLSREKGTRCLVCIRNLAEMKLDEHRRPIDGRGRFQLADGRWLDLRVSSIPTLHGESVAVRLLVPDPHLRRLDLLGFVGPQLELLNGVLESSGGLVLMTGPTGCGKTTTLYACLHALNDGRRKIHTLEDPIEYSVRGLYQTQVSTFHGTDFADMLRAVVRQNPDVIMIGELRHPLAVETAVRAANSGQLVFASLHSAVAASAIQSLICLGATPYFLATSLLAIVSQRLMRTISVESRVPINLSMAPQTFEEVRPWLQPDQGQTVYAANSDGNQDAGYDGLTGLFEVLIVSPAIRKLIAEGRHPTEIARCAVDEGMLEFRRAALIKVAQGLTSFDEMRRAVPNIADALLGEV